MVRRTQKLAEQGVSIWLDDLSRERITSGNLAELIETRDISGVTTNPTIFAAALTDGESYAQQVQEVAAQGLRGDAAIFEIITEDVRNACTIMRPIYDTTSGEDGRVSIEVSPDLAFETEATAAQAKELWAKVDRPNAMIKIPATREGLPAITDAIGEGISVNVTLIFSLERYAEVIEAYLEGLEKAQRNGKVLAEIRSVASFFVSRVDTEVDKRLEALGTPAAQALAGKAGVANARLAYELFQRKFSGERWEKLADAGAHLQRPLWASTGVKNPAYPDTLYVTELVAAETVNTMPEKTLEAVYDHGEVTGDTITANFTDAHEVFDALTAVGVDMKDVTDLLEKEGVEKFIVSWKELQNTVNTAIDKAQA
ncbi:transaldolase [Actinobaculum suis]|uniref:transaldolase n=1 Tax=Actinobaculum suis TaxID=1657 RepID=UPI00080872F1|nr:transaldolase [Actinobaculum suis]OCA96108.1 transaldolase [Actinobaculum suis]